MRPNLKSRKPIKNNPTANKIYSESEEKLLEPLSQELKILTTQIEDFQDYEGTRMMNSRKTIWITMTLLGR